jgi:hypothetical protein
VRNLYFSFPDILPTYDILILPLTPLRSIEPIGEEIIIAMITWAFIDIRPSPWIDRDFLWKIRPLPTLGSRGLFTEGL